MALIAMALYSTEENKKDKCLARTLSSLSATVDFTKHRLMLSVNGMTDETRFIIKHFKDIISEVIYNPTNLGTAEAINLCWRKRNPGEHCIKMDDDIVIEQPRWIETLEECIKREPRIGQIGLKRSDCCETTWHPDKNYRSELLMLPHEAGQRWLIVEKVRHVMGSCVMHNSDLLDKVGYLRQFGKYGFDDCIMSYRSEIAGFINCHYSSVVIHHIDEGKTEYQTWKEKYSSEKFPEFYKLVDKLISGEEPIYYTPFK